VRGSISSAIATPAIADAGAEDAGFVDTVSPSASSCTASTIAWTVEQTAGNTTTATTTPAAQSYCGGGGNFSICFTQCSTAVWPPNFDFSPTGTTAATMGELSGVCLSSENLPILQPQNPAQLGVPLLVASNPTSDTASPPIDTGLAQAKFTAIQKAITLSDGNTYDPFSTMPAGWTTASYDAALNAYLVGEAELLYELEGEYLTTAQQQAVWSLYVNNDARESCESSWTPTVPAGENLCTNGVPSPAIETSGTWGSYMQRALEACTALASPHASVGAATQLAAQCLGLATQIPNGAGTETVDVAAPCSGRFCTEYTMIEHETCSYQPYRDQWQAMATALIEKVLQGTSALPALQPGAATPTTADPSVQGELSLIQRWYEGERYLTEASAMVATSLTGTGASVAATSSAGPFTVSGLSGMSAANVGQYIVLSGSASNNAAFVIQSVPSATSVTIASGLTTTDANNGNISWQILSAPAVNWTPLWNQTSAVVGAFWTGATTPAANALAANPTNAQAAQIFTTSSLAMDEAVLSAAFSPALAAAAPSWSPATGSPPLTSAPLLYLVGDVVQMVSQRLEYADLFHDFACRFAGCTQTKTAVSEMWQSLSSLADPTALQTALAASPNIGNWSTAFGALQRNHAATLEAAVLDATGAASYASSLLTSASSGSAAPVLGLAQALQAAGVHTTSYAKTGLFGRAPYATSAAGVTSQANQIQTADSPNTLSVGLQDVFLGTNTGTTSSGQNTETLTERFNALYQALETDITDFSTQQSAAINGVIGTNTNTSKTQDLTQQIAGVQSQLAYLDGQIAGLQSNDAAQTASFGSFMTAFNSVANSNAVDSDALNPVKTFNTSITPASGLGSTLGNIQTWNDIRQLAILPSAGSNWPSKLALPAGTAATNGSIPAGWMLNLSVSGQWTPTCALRSTEVYVSTLGNNNGGGLNLQGGANNTIGGNQELGINGAENALTGPQGYYVTVQNGLALAASVTYNQGSGEMSSSSTITTNINCSTASNGTQCLSGTTGQSYTSNNTGTWGFNADLGASFAEGIRSNYDPFPTAPTGALLLVQMTPGKYTSADVLDVQVVQPQMSVLINKTADVYLVDNDISGCTFPQPGALVVSLTELQPTGTLAPLLGTAMVTALNDINTMAPGLVSQGTILPDDMAALSAKATSDLNTLIPANVSIPGALAALFSSWVEEQLVHIEREVEIANLVQQGSLLEMQLTQYQQDVTANGTAGRYYALETSQAIENMNAYQGGMQSSLTALLQLMTEELYPAAALKYPNALSTISSLSSQLTTLSSGLDWTNIDVGQVTTAQQLALSINTDFVAAVGSSPTQGKYFPIALTFPNPAYTPTIGAGPSSYWLQADPATSAAVWAAANSGGSVSFTISPQDLYAASGTGEVPCTKAAPIIDSMALVLGTESNDPSGATLSENHWNFPLSFGAEQGFPTAAGLQMYDFSDPTWLSGSNVYLLAGPAMDAVDQVASAMTANPNISYTAGAGLSPFSTITLGFGGTGQGSLPYVLTNVVSAPPTELVLVMNIETVTAVGGVDLSWISTCSPSALADAAKQTATAAK
jgi:hypothetical protein